MLLAGSCESLLSGHSKEAGSLRFILPALAVLVLSLQLPATVYWLRRLRYEGVGYSSRVWVQSALVKQIKSLDASVYLFSNAPDVVYTLAGRPAVMIPRKIYPDNNQPNPNYNSEIEAMKNSLKAKNRLLVYFYGIRWRWYLPSADEIDAMGFTALVRTGDGSIYQFNKP